MNRNAFFFLADFTFIDGVPLKDISASMLNDVRSVKQDHESTSALISNLPCDLTLIESCPSHCHLKSQTLPM